MNSYLTKCVAICYLALGLWHCVFHDFAPVSTTIAFVVLAGLAYAFEIFWLIALVPSIVLISLYPLTGELLFTEQDIALCGLIGGKLLSSTRVQLDYSSLGISWFFVAVVWIAAALNGWSNLPSALPSDQFSVYTTRNNAILQAKPILFAVTLVPMLVSVFRNQCLATRNRNWSAIEHGFTATTIGVCAAVLAERYVTFGLWDWDTELRVAGPCMSMHIGDQHIDAYWAIALPYVFQFTTLRIFAILFRLSLMIVATYAIFATMSRATIASTLILAAFVIVAKECYFRRVTSSFFKNRITIFGVVTFGVAGIVGISVLLWFAGTAVPARFGAISEGLSDRIGHWQTVCRMNGQSYLRLWFGTGLGTYPIEYRKFVGRTLQPIALTKKGDMTGLRLLAEEKNYAAQLVDSNAPLPWRIQLELQRSTAECNLGLSVCHQVLLQSNDCVPANRVSVQQVEGVEQQLYELTQLPSDLASDAKQTQRDWSPTALSLSVNGNAGSWIEVYRCKVVDANGMDLVQNFDFKQGSKHWFFVSDDHLVWRAKNSWLHLNAEIGLMGCFFGVALCGMLVRQCFSMAFLTRSWPAFVILTASIGFLPIGMFGTLVDVPWILLLVIVQLAIAQGVKATCTMKPDHFATIESGNRDES